MTAIRVTGEGGGSATVNPPGGNAPKRCKR
jgi:hypothetical protein